MKKFKDFKPLLSLLKEEKKSLIIASIIIFISEFSNTFSGYLNGEAVESITKMEIKNAIMYLGIYFFLSLFLDGFLYLKGWAMLRNTENKISRNLEYKTYGKVLDLKAYAFEKTTSGEYINRVTNDTGTISMVFGNLVNLLSNFVGTFIIAVYVFMNSWIIGLEIVVFLIILFFVIKKLNPVVIKTHKERKIESDKFASLVTESIRGIREIKTLGIKKNLLKNANENIKGIYNKTKDEIALNKKFRITSKAIKTVMEVCVFLTCIILMYYGKTTLSFFIAMTYYVYRFMWLIDAIDNFNEMYQKLYVSLNRINEVLTNSLYPDEEFGNKSIKKIKGEIEFRNVEFGYPDERIILKNFNLKIEPHKKIAIVGSSGQGKSTLFNLLTRIFDPLKGEILIDNVNIKDLSESELRHHISIIRQEPFIFNRSIHDNFRLIKKNITIDEIRKYTKMAYLDDYIMSLPEKYETILGEGGVNLSGGQKQRLSIARTLAKQSKIILFDEATSSLDNKSQEYIKKSIDNLVKDHTVIIVAHRLSTIIDSDIIHVVNKGKIIASGTHEELLKTNKTYKNLYETDSLNS